MSAKELDLGLFDDSGHSDTECKWARLRKTKDPYAYYEVFGFPDESQPLATQKPTPLVSSYPVNKMSKRDFQSACRRIFTPYIPSAEGLILRPHYRDFIVRNENRSPEERFRLAEALGQYDLSKSGNFKPHFNREKELPTVAKLQQIEKKALKQRVSE